MHSGHIVSVKKLSTDLSDEEAIERCRLAFENSGRDELEQSRLSVRGYRQLDDLYRIGHPKAAASVLQMEAQSMMILSGRFTDFCRAMSPRLTSPRGECEQSSRGATPSPRNTTSPIVAPTRTGPW